MDFECTFLTIKDICKFLGLGRNKVLQLCQERTAGFPAVKVGNRYQSDLEKLTAWKDAWYRGEFEIR